MAAREPSRSHVAIAPALVGDVDRLRSLAVVTGMFDEHDLGGFDEMLLGYLDGSLNAHRWLLARDSAGEVQGAAYYAPESFADRVWNLYFLAVHPRQHRGGIGAALVATVEQSLRSEGEQSARVLIVETSGTDRYEGARRFYAQQGFDREARIREYYGPEDDKIVYWKSLAGPATSVSAL